MSGEAVASSRSDRAGCDSNEADNAEPALVFGPCGNCGGSLDHRTDAGTYPCKAHGGWR